MKIAICDDDKFFVEQLNQIIKSMQGYRNIDIYKYTSGEELVLAHKNKGLRFEIIFLDIKMDKMSGIETAKKITELGGNSLIIFVTAYMDYVFEGYEVRAFRYIMKPICEKDVKKHFLKAIKELYDEDKRYSIHTKSTILTFNIDDIVFLESSKRQVVANTTTSKISFYSKLSMEEEKLKRFGFVRVHQGFLVNMAHMKTIIDNDIILHNGTYIPISKSKKKQTLNQYTKYLTEFDII